MSWDNFTREDILDAVHNSWVHVYVHIDIRSLTRENLIKTIMEQSVRTIDKIKVELNKGVKNG